MKRLALSAVHSKLWYRKELTRGVMFYHPWTLYYEVGCFIWCFSLYVSLFLWYPNLLPHFTGVFFFPCNCFILSNNYIVTSKTSFKANVIWTTLLFMLFSVPSIYFICIRKFSSDLLIIIEGTFLLVVDMMDSNFDSSICRFISQDETPVRTVKN